MWLFLAVVREKGLSYRKGIGRVRGNLKHVHWLIMCLCSLKMRQVSEQQQPFVGSEDVFSWLRCFFAELQFAQTAFNLQEPPHCLVRDAGLPDHPIFLACPVRGSNWNLASTVQPDKVTRIQQCLRGVIGAITLRARLPSATAVSPPAAVVANPPSPRHEAMAAAAMVEPTPLLNLPVAAAAPGALPVVAAAPGALPVVAAARGGKFNCPEWLTIERDILDHELSAHGVRVLECKFNGHAVWVSLPDNSSFGVLPVVLYVHGAGGDTPIDRLKGKAQKANKRGAHYGSRFLDTLKVTMWVAPQCPSSQAKSWKSPPALWVLHLAERFKSLGCSSSGPGAGVHLFGMSRGAWWGSVFAGERPELFASVWIVGGYPSVSDVESNGKANALRLSACTGSVWLVGSEADSCSPARSYSTWYSTLTEQHPSDRFHSYVVPESLNVSHGQLGDLPYKEPHMSLDNAYHAFHSLFS